MAVAPKRTRLAPAVRRELIEQAATEVFAERGYHEASTEEIARRSGVSVPVLYDHFPSKQELHRRLLEKHYAELRTVWRHLAGDDPPEQRIARTLTAWFHYVHDNPYAWRMMFRDSTGGGAAEDIRRAVAAESQARILPLFARERGAADDVELAWEAWRAAIQGLALWWSEHPGVPLEHLVETTMNTLWLGLDRIRAGERWRPSPATDAAEST